MAMLQDDLLSRVIVRFSVEDPSVLQKRRELWRLVEQFAMTTAQALKLLAHFPPGERIDALEILLLRIVDLDEPLNQGQLVAVFKGQHCERVRALLARQLAGSVRQRYAPFRPWVISAWTQDDVNKLKDVIDVRLSRSNDRRKMLEVLVRGRGFGLSWEQLRQVVEHFVLAGIGAHTPISEALASFEHLLQVLAPSVPGLGDANVLPALRFLSQRVPALVLPMLRFMARHVDVPGSTTRLVSIIGESLGDETADALRALLAREPTQPCMHLFGNLLYTGSRRIIFCVDGSRTMEAVTDPNNCERITNWRLAVREMTHVLKDHLCSAEEIAGRAGGTAQAESNPLTAEQTFFNVVIFADAPVLWSDRMEPVTIATVQNASLFLRQAYGQGPHDLAAACRSVFSRIVAGDWEVDALQLLLFTTPTAKGSTEAVAPAVPVEAVGAATPSPRTPTSEPGSGRVLREVTEAGAAGGSLARAVQTRAAPLAPPHTADTVADRVRTTVLDVAQELERLDPLENKLLFKVHATFVVNSQTPRDELPALERYVEGLCHVGRQLGQHRLVSVSHKVTKYHQLAKATREAGPLGVSRVALYGLQLWIVLVYVAQLLCTALISGGWKVPLSCAEVSSLYPRYLNFSEGSMRLWRFQQLALAITVIFLCTSRRLFSEQKGFARRQRVLFVFAPYFTAYSVLLLGTLLFWVHNSLVSAFVCASFTTLVLALMHAGFVVGRRIVPTRDRSFRLERSRAWLPEVLFLHAPISITLALFMALFLQLVFMVVEEKLHLSRDFEFPFAVLLIVLLFGVALYLLLKHRDVPYALTSAMVLRSFSRNQVPVSLTVRTINLTLSPGLTSGEFVLELSIYLMRATLVFFALARLFLAFHDMYHVHGLKKKRSALPSAPQPRQQPQQPHQPHQHATEPGAAHQSSKERHGIARKRATDRMELLKCMNLSGYALLVVVFWGRSSILGRRLCFQSLYAQFAAGNAVQAPPYLMLPRWSFRVAWILLTIWKGAFAVLQALPSESLLLSREELTLREEEDRNLGIKAYVRRYQGYSVPFLTWRFEHLVVHQVGSGFLYVCLLEAIFVAFFNNGLFSGSLVVLVVLLFLMVWLYGDVVGFSERNVFCQRPHGVCSCRCCCLAQPRSNSRHGPGKVARLVRRLLGTRLLTEAEARLVLRDVSAPAGRSPLTPIDSPSPLRERVFVRVPLGLYMGWLAYLPFLTSNLVVLSRAPSLDFQHFAGIRHAWWVALALGLELPAVAMLGFRANNPAVLVGWAWAVAGLVVENWAAVCDSVSDPPSLARVWITRRSQPAGGPFFKYADRDAAECAALGEEAIFVDDMCRRVQQSCAPGPPPGFTASDDGACFEYPFVCPLGGVLDATHAPPDPFLVGCFGVLALFLAVALFLWTLFLSPSRRTIRREAQLTARRTKVMMSFA